DDYCRRVAVVVCGEEAAPLQWRAKGREKPRARETRLDGYGVRWIVHAIPKGHSRHSRSRCGHATRHRSSLHARCLGKPIQQIVEIRARPRVCVGAHVRREEMTDLESGLD